MGIDPIGSNKSHSIQSSHFVQDSHGGGGNSYVNGKAKRKKVETFQNDKSQDDEPGINDIYINIINIIYKSILKYLKKFLTYIKFQALKIPGLSIAISIKAIGFARIIIKKITEKKRPNNFFQ